MSPRPLHLFEGFGIELEYMIVDADTLDVRPLADLLLKAAAGEIVSEIEFGSLAWSNELALHVIELKTAGPAKSLEPLTAAFQKDVRRINQLLADLGARLMPTAMHPWMDPDRELKLWPHDYSPVYEAFNRIFDCRGHGWANLQSVHINLPFADDDEFSRLHAAIRLILPLLPALAASSPVMEGRATGLLDNRLNVYKGNSARIPQVSGRIIPERAFSRSEYAAMIFEPMYDAIAPYDTENVLQDEFLNARGAIARFSRNAIEIRLLDIQECPRADLAICAAVIAVLRGLVEERWSSLAEQQAFEIEPLATLLDRTITDAHAATLDDPGFLAAFGVHTETYAAGEFWQRLIDRERRESPAFDRLWGPTLSALVERGPLANRILSAVGKEPTRERCATVYRALCDCLQTGELFLPTATGSPL